MATQSVRRRASKSVMHSNPTVLDKSDPGLISSVYECRLDERFNERYLRACAEERMRYYTSNAANTASVGIVS